MGRLFEPITIRGAQTARVLSAAVLAAGLAGCRGKTSEAPPVHLNPNMDHQSSFKPQEENTFFADGRAMRPPVAGTVARGELREDDHYFRGKVNGQYATTLPVPLTIDLVRRGQERFDIYCAPCHGQTGIGDGIVVQRGMTQPPNFHDERVLKMPVGEIVEVISNGVRTMPPYRNAIPVADRWAIAAYLRALQISRRAGLDQVPADISGSKGWK